MREDIRYFLPPPEPLPFVAEMCGISYCDGTYRIQRTDSSVCVMEYVVKGTGTILTGGDRREASAGDVYILPLGSNHVYFSDRQDPWTKIFINCRGPAVSALLKAYGLVGQVVYKACPVEALFRELFSTAGSGLPQEQRIEQCALKFHEIVAAVSAHVRSRERPPVSEEALRLKNAIESRLDYNYSIRELGALIYRSEDYVIKLFGKSFGQTPHAYATALRLRMACRLLKETHMGVAEIASTLGYEDAKYFTHVFRRNKGVSPTAYREGR